jgi:hypothetical protein
MKKLVKSMFFLIIIGVLMYSLYDKFHIALWVDEMINKEDENQDLNLVNEVYTAMVEGKDSIELQYVGKVDDMNWFTDWVVDEVYKIDDASTSDDSDYLKFKTESIYTHISGYGNFLTVTYDFEYNESRTETDLVNEKVGDLLVEWDIDSLSDFNKVKTIHDYIVNNASYDVNLEKFSAYDNLINKSSTCQGYITIGYKMLTEAGIPCRIISGLGDGQSHGWNIVELDGKWYNLDLTWDDPLVEGADLLVYDYFLKSEEEFTGHKRDAIYNTDEFYENHIMALEGYK